MKVSDNTTNIRKDDFLRAIVTQFSKISGKCADRIAVANIH